MAMWKLSSGVVLAALCCALGCESAPVTSDDGGAGAGSGGSTVNGGSGSDDEPVLPSACSGALRQALGLVDEVSTATVAPIASGAELVLFIDASAGGLGGQDAFPWVYVSLSTGQAVALTDLEALESPDWDLAFKRFVIRTNSGDSGPGTGGALRVGLPWESVDGSTQGDRALLTESWFDQDCNLTIDEQGELVTTFTGWSEYDQASHVLAPADAVYLTQGGDGKRYKVAILDYYANPDGSTGRTAGRYKVRVAALP
jgi:hypothetical protein